MADYPPVYRQILKSRLIAPEVLQTVCDDLKATLGEDYGDMLLAELELRGHLNPWQVSQLLHSRTRFHLGQYRIVDSLGMGGYGQVFLARNSLDSSNLGRKDSPQKRPSDVAIKVLPLTKANDRAVKKFQREISIHRELNHENIIQFIESAIDGNVHYAVYEYADRKDVRSLLKKSEPLQYTMATSIVYEVVSALIYLHRKGIVHKDIKPANILLTSMGEVKLADFGLSCRMNMAEGLDSEESPSKKKRVEGTSDYISPDQVLHPDQPTPAWDIYSLGCTFYYLVTGIVPFPCGNSQQKVRAHLHQQAPEPKMFQHQLPNELSHLIQEMMSKTAEERPRCDETLLARLYPWRLSQTTMQEEIARLFASQAQQNDPLPLAEPPEDSFFASLESFAQKENEKNSSTLLPLPSTEDAAQESSSQALLLEESQTIRPEQKLVRILFWGIFLPLLILNIILWFLR